MAAYVFWTGMTAKRPGPMERVLTYATFLAVVLGGGMLIGSVTQPDAWYVALTKPSFNPPDWIFAPVWAVLYLLIALAGARTFERGTGFSLWLGQMVLNFAWAPVFFGLHQP